MRGAREKARGLATAKRSGSPRSVIAPPGIDTARAKPARMDLSTAKKAANVHGGTGEPDRGTWCTPAWLAERIGPVDLDPCSNPRSHIQAARSCQLERGEDGLAIASSIPSSARVFINPPYERGAVVQWIRAYAHTRTIYLVRFDVSTDWFVELYRSARLVAIPRGRRVNFEPPPGVTGSSSTFPHALIYAHAEDATPAVLRACIAWRPRP